MTSIVEISAAQESLSCTVGDTVHVTFDVTNSQPDRMKIGAQFIAERPEPKAWLTLDGESERRLEPNAKTRINVSVSVPETASPGTHEFGLLVFDTKEPGEKFDESPPVAVNVLERVAEYVPPPPIVHPRRGWLLTCLGFAGALIMSILSSILFVIIFEMVFDRKSFREAFTISNNDKINTWSGGEFLSMIFFACFIGGILSAISTRRVFNLKLIAIGGVVPAISAYMLLFNFWPVQMLSGVLVSFYGFHFWKKYQATKNP